MSEQQELMGTIDYPYFYVAPSGLGVIELCNIAPHEEAGHYYVESVDGRKWVLVDEEAYAILVPTEDKETNMYDIDECEKVVERCEVEFGGELPDLNIAGGATYRDRARRLLEEAERQGENFSDDDRAAIEFMAEDD